MMSTPSANQLGAAALRIGLVNNMPDSALEATEQQFASLLRAAAGAVPFTLHFFSMPDVPRGEAAARRIASAYRPWTELWSGGLDALIVTGAEPRAPRLDQESYWRGLTELIDWARTEVGGSIWSCLAAHAAVLHLDGIERQRLPDKCFGVFAHEVDRDHPLTHGSPALQPAPHSRWNELRSDSLEAHGYRILTRSAAAGANLFAKDFGSAFLFWQGHPEYEEKTLLKEYQRDVLRYLRGERDTYPSPPVGYFDDAVARRMVEFRERALRRRGEEIAASFPFEAAAAGAVNSWRTPALRIYGNWLEGIARTKAARARL